MRRTTITAWAVVGVSALLMLGGCSDSDDGGTADGGGDGSPGTTAPASDAGASGEIALLSYNVAGLPQEISDVNPEEHIPLISPRLEPYDLVLTQEDFDWWQPQGEDFDFSNYHDRLRAETTHEHASAKHPGPEAVGLDWEVDRPTLLIGDGLGYLSRYPFTDEVRVPWTGCRGGADTSDGGAADCLAMKGFAVITVELAPGVEVDVYNLHVEAGGHEDDQALQADDIVQLAAFMAEHSEGRAVILAGDTNLHTDGDHPDSDGPADDEIWTTFLAETGLTDACDIVTCEDPGAIDKAAVRDGGGVSLEVTSAVFVPEDFLDDDGEDLSDHHPLAVDITWSATG